jgi:hypothetical protein
MINNPLNQERYNTIPSNDEGVLFKDSSDFAFQAKSLTLIQECSIKIKKLNIKFYEEFLEQLFDDFDLPKLPYGHLLKRMMLYRINHSEWRDQ